MKTFRPNAQNGGGNALNKFQGPQVPKSPYEFDYRDKDVMDIGDVARIRIFTLAEDDIEIIPCKRGNIIVPNRNQPIGKVVHNLGQSLEDLEDHEGNLFPEWQGTVLYRVPVWVYGVTKNGSWKEYEKLMFIEFGPGLKKALDTLKKDPSGAFAFDEKTEVPEYDLLLQVNKGDGTIPKSYDFSGVNMDGRTKSIDANYNKPAEEVLSDVIDEIIETMDLMKPDMTARMTEEYIRHEFRKRDANRSDRPAQESPISKRFGNSEPKDEEKPKYDYSDEPEATTEQPQPATRTRSKRNFSFSD